MLELKEEVKGVATTYPLLTNDDLLKSQTVSDNTVATTDGIPTEDLDSSLHSMEERPLQDIWNYLDPNDE